MQEIRMLIKKMDEMKSDWRECYLDEQHREEIYADEIGNLLNNISKLIEDKKREFVDNPDVEQEEAWKRELADLLGNEVFQSIEVNMKTVIEMYAAMQIIRKNENNIVPFLEDAIYNVCVRYSPSFLEKNEKYGVESEADFAKAVHVIKVMVTTHAEQYLSRQKAEIEFKRVTGIEEPYSNYYGEVYDRYFERIQRNSTLDLLNGINEKLNFLTQNIAFLERNA